MDRFSCSCFDDIGDVVDFVFKWLVVGWWKVAWHNYVLRWQSWSLSNRPCGGTIFFDGFWRWKRRIADGCLYCVMVTGYYSMDGWTIHILLQYCWWRLWYQVLCRWHALVLWCWGLCGSWRSRFAPVGFHLNDLVWGPRRDRKKKQLIILLGSRILSHDWLKTLLLCNKQLEM